MFLPLEINKRNMLSEFFEFLGIILSSASQQIMSQQLELDKCSPIPWPDLLVGINFVMDFFNSVSTFLAV